ncbi:MULTISPECIES: NAD-dependent epimerase/dehydratase family protein [Arthrobacter]|uniref:NAD-dependent epimerase/dehydratase family protein n=1 Tax=Arthrobacter terricola TaxID=2547396 RepID=A0A4V2ZS88_9MICC|nr:MULTISPECIES: NAD-dependent epimerase/dehydratase family protein [Arthrobacter]MBT8162259.1 NAD(P)H-binding protein [Arthrobacter sp. GN70]TDF92264.1 NAD-dependent epimerase/dehydratase family protein [Arthrobacter terricola]
MVNQLVLGAGLIGGALAQRLIARGDHVTLGTRSGTTVPGATALKVDASDAAAVTEAARGAETIFVCTNPPYTDWATDWPPIFDAVIAAARDSGAALVLMGNLYAYGAPAGAMTEDSPLATTEKKGLVRKAGWEKALAAHQRGEIRVTEVRASDYFGPGAAGMSTHLGGGFFEPLLASKTARVVGDPALDHGWSFLPDIATTLIAAADYTGEWGRPWHVPSASLPRTEIVRQINERWGVTGKVARTPQWSLKLLGAVVPIMREVSASSYQFEMPFVIDSAETQQLLGVSATPWDEALETTVNSFRKNAAVK